MMKYLRVALFCLATIFGGAQGALLVDSVIAGGPAERAGLQGGDRIAEIAGQKIESLDDLQAVTGAHKPGDTVQVKVLREDDEVVLSLTFAERAGGGASMGVRLRLAHGQGGHSHGGASGPAGEGTKECLQWIESTYRPIAMMERLNLDLLDVYQEMQTCVGRDTGGMPDEKAVKYCDNIFKVHCSGVDLLTEIGEAQVDWCQEQLEREFGPAVGESKAWQTCGKQKIFEAYSLRGEASDAGACRKIYQDGCTDAQKPEPGAKSRSPVETANPGTGEPQAAWLQWGGPAQDFTAPAAAIAGTWPDEGPRKLWSRDLGQGYSAVLVEEERLYTMYRAGSAEVVICLDAASGETIWEHRYEHVPHQNHVHVFGEGPNATPMLSGNRLFTVGIAGKMHALQKSDGKVIWSRELWGEEFKGNVLEHGYSSSPLAYKDMVIVPVGGQDAGLVALDQKTGVVRWQGLDFRNSYSSPRLVRLADVEQVVVFMADELIGVDPATGKLHWRFPHMNQWHHNITMPMVVDGDLVFLSSPQAGARGLRISGEPGAMAVEEVWSNRRIQFYHVSSVRQGDWVYGSTGTMALTFMAAVNMQTGEIGWRERGFAKANTVQAGGKLVILDEDGMLYLASVTPETLVVHASTQLLDRVAWTVPTIVGNKMFVRNTREILALDLG